MIQTQLLKADQPYQIISAAGQVGIQVATLIVTEDKTTDKGYQIDTHSHPVVNYAVKDGLTEELKYWNRNPEEEWQYALRLQPEGAVWNKVEVRDIRVLGLVGAENPRVDLETFVSLVPREYIVGLPDIFAIWGPRTPAKIRNLHWGLEKVGIKCETSTTNVSPDRDGYIYIQLDKNKDFGNPLVCVTIRESEDEVSWPHNEPICFWCPLDEANPTECMHTIVACMEELDEQFIQGREKIRFSLPPNEQDELLKRMVQHINSLVWKNRYGIR